MPDRLQSTPSLISVRTAGGKRIVVIPDDVTAREAAALALFLVWSGRLSHDSADVQGTIADLGIGRLFGPEQPRND